jgi:adenine-specific DNA-methyltransferase
MPFLDWVNKNQAVQTSDEVPYHLLQHQKSVGDQATANDNLIIQGDNLQALKALLPFYTGKVKCIFIDPPYNTQSAFEHYDDKLEHSQWLSMMYPRLVLLRELLAEDGSIWITIDDNEAHYLKVLMDEVFGRKNFLCAIAWEKRYSPPPDTKDFGYVHDIILVYRKTQAFKRNLLPPTEDQTGRYKNPDNDPRGPWKAMDYTCRFTAEERPNLYYPIKQPNTGVEVWPKKSRVWAMSKEVHLQNELENKIWWGGKGTNSVPALKNHIDTVAQGMMPMSIWKHGLAGHNQDGKKESLALHDGVAFSTPKPERLLSVILTVATIKSDIVLDSFLGSGTTAAVAHKMGRRYIGIEMGEHAVTHCIPRLEKVIDGEQGGISKAVEWQGGGGFSFYTLGAPVFDAEGHITADVRFKDLAAYIWWLETKTATGVKVSKANSPFIGEQDGVAYYLLYNGILGDRRPAGGNVLTSAVLADLMDEHPHTGQKVIFGEASRLGIARLARENIEFKQIPYELHDRV